MRRQSRLAAKGRQRADLLARRFGSELRLARTASGLSQLAGPEEVLHVEVERRLVDLQAQLRAAQVKRSVLEGRFDRPVRLVIAVPATVRNREILTSLAPILRAGLPKSSADVWRAIRTGRQLGADGLLVVR